MLTTKQERFALNLFQDMPQREAYIKAGYSANQLPAVIDVNACNLAKNNKVVLRLQELRKQVSKSVIMSIEEKQKILSEIAYHSVEKPVSAGAKIAAIAELNRMHGDYAPERKQIDINLDVVFQIGQGYKEVTSNNASNNASNDASMKELTSGSGSPTQS